MMLTSEDVLQKIEDSGYRTTASRRRLVEALVARADGFTPEELVDEVKGVGRATVYRTIRLLLEQGLVCKLALHDGTPRYSLSSIAHHHHLVCVRCGTVRAFRQSAMERVLKDLRAEDAGNVVGHRVEVYVVCPKCQGKVAKGEAPQKATPSHNPTDGA